MHGGAVLAMERHVCGDSKSTAVVQASSFHLQPEAASTDLAPPPRIEDHQTAGPGLWPVIE